MFARSTRPTCNSTAEGIVVWSNLPSPGTFVRSEEHTSELQSRSDLVCRLLLEKKKNALATDPFGRAHGGTPVTTKPPTPATRTTPHIGRAHSGNTRTETLPISATASIQQHR